MNKINHDLNKHQSGNNMKWKSYTIKQSIHDPNVVATGFNQEYNYHKLLKCNKNYK